MPSANQLLRCTNRSRGCDRHDDLDCLSIRLPEKMEVIKEQEASPSDRGPSHRRGESESLSNVEALFDRQKEELCLGSLTANAK